MSNFFHRGCAFGADIHRLIVSAVCFERKQVCFRDVRHVNEIASLLPVLKNQRSVAIQKPGGKDRAYSRIRIRQGLSWTIDIKVPQCNRRNAIRTANNQTKLFLILFCYSIYRCWKKRFRFGSSFWSKWLAT